ncbi:MAG: GNAT family N-acetyltransferase [Armatimonas sp.]
MHLIDISTEQSRLDIARIHRWLSEESYWAQNIPETTLRRALENSLCIGAYDSDTGEQLGLARVITDYATFAYLCDVFVVTNRQGQGIGKQLIEAVCAELEPLKLRRWALATRDAHGLYEQYGFVNAPEGHWMHRLFRDVYVPR